MLLADSAYCTGSPLDFSFQTSNMAVSFLQVVIHLCFFLFACDLCVCALGDVQTVNVNITRVVEHLSTLSHISDAPPPAVTRILFTERDVEAREFLRGVVQDAGLSFRVDAIGNIFARLPGSEPTAGVVGTGSHYDAIPHSGMYDGTLGVLGAVEAIRALRDSGFRPRKSLELLAFTSEEPTRFKLSCIGSRALVGQKSPADLVTLRDADGVSFEEARKTAGVSGDLGSVLLKKDYYDAFVELHIEQGKRLEDEGLDIGMCRIHYAECVVAVLHPFGRIVVAIASRELLSQLTWLCSLYICPACGITTVGFDHIGVVTAIAGPATAEVTFEGTGALLIFLAILHTLWRLLSA